MEEIKITTAIRLIELILYHNAYMQEEWNKTIHVIRIILRIKMTLHQHGDLHKNNIIILVMKRMDI